MLTGMVGCDMDPGYSGTARMLAESALCLALDVRECGVNEMGMI